MNRLRLTSIALFILIPIALGFCAYLFWRLKDTIGIIIPVFMVGVCLLMAIPPLISFFASAHWSDSSVRLMTIINSLQIGLIVIIGLWLSFTEIMGRREHPQQTAANLEMLQQYHASPSMQGVIDKCTGMFSESPYLIYCDQANDKCFALLISAPGSASYATFGSTALMTRPASNSNPNPKQLKYKAISATFLVYPSFVQPLLQEYTEVFADNDTDARIELLNEFTKNWQFYKGYGTNKSSAFWDQWIFRR